jgi:hypothetical protein
LTLKELEGQGGEFSKPFHKEKPKGEGRHFSNKVFRKVVLRV